MSRCSGSLITVFSLILLGGLLMMSGCSDDDPVTPDTLPAGGYLAVSPDSLMALWQTALASMDSTMYGDMYDPDFRFHFSASDMSEFGLLTDHMTRDETVQTAWNMFTGQDVRNWQGVDIPAVSRISFPQMDQETPWEIVAVGFEPPVATARFLMQMFVERGSGISTIFAGGSYMFSAVVRDTILADGTATQYYRLINMVPVEPGPKIGVINSWGGVHLTYLTNEAPQAEMTVTDIGGSPLPVFHCDASASSDGDSGLHPEPYRWQFEGGGDWTDWSADPTTNHSYLRPRGHTITVKVRDRWGATGTASQEVIQPGLPFPGSPDILMSNFQTIYETRDFDQFREIMHPDFLTILQETTTIEFPDVGTTLDVNEELRLHERMFSGDAVTDPEGFLVPGVLDVSFSRFYALDTWAMSPPDDIIPNAMWAPYAVEFLFDRGQEFSTLKVNGIIKFYVTSSDFLHEGVVRQYYQMIGQVDLTNLKKAVESTNWGSVKALYR